MEQVSSDLPVSPPNPEGSGEDARIMVKESRRNVFLDWLAGTILTPLFLLIWWLTLQHYLKNDRLRDETLDLTVFFGYIPPVVLSIWLQIRMIPRMRGMGTTTFRRALTVAPIQAKEILRRLLIRPIVRIALPIPAIAITQIILLPVPDIGGTDSIVALFVVLTSIQIATLAFSISESLKAFADACRAGGDSLNVVVRVIFISVGIALFPLVMFFLSIRFYPLGAPVLAVPIVLLARSRWRKLCDVYLKMEP